MRPRFRRGASVEWVCSPVAATGVEKIQVYLTSTCPSVVIPCPTIRVSDTMELVRQPLTQVVEKQRDDKCLEIRMQCFTGKNTVGTKQVQTQSVLPEKSTLGWFGYLLLFFLRLFISREGERKRACTEGQREREGEKQNPC